MKLSERIRRARKQAGLSQLALAELLGVQRSAVSNWESARQVHPSIGHLIEIANATLVSFEWLATNRGQMRVDHDPLLDTPSIDADMVEEPDERELLLHFRGMSRRSQELVLVLCRELRTARRGMPARRAHGQ